MENEPEVKVEQTSNEKDLQKKMSPVLIIVLVLALGLIAFFGLFRSNKSVVPLSPSPSAMTEEKVKGYTIDDVAKHSGKDDCWMVIDNNVYDVTKFIPMHKGGDQILLGCGKDATELFKSNEKHGVSAQKMLQGLQIGILAGS